MLVSGDIWCPRIDKVLYQAVKFLFKFGDFWVMQLLARFPLMSPNPANLQH